MCDFKLVVHSVARRKDRRQVYNSKFRDRHARVRRTRRSLIFGLFLGSVNWTISSTSSTFGMYAAEFVKGHKQRGDQVAIIGIVDLRSI